jgi:hypothetical protein
MHSWNTFGAKMNHGQIQQDSPRPELGGSHHLPSYSILCVCPQDQHPFVPGLPSGSPKILTSRTPTTSGAHNFVCRPLIEMRSKAKFILCQELSNNMSHTTYTWGDWGGVIESQISNNFDPSFGHNLCFKCPNGSCEPIQTFSF